jgi:hypothetical protein
MPTCTDGRLTVANLAREARVSRATANRATGVLAELRRIAGEAPAKALRVHTRPTEKDEELTRRAFEDVLAQHAQARALLRREEERRVGRIVSIRPVGRVD